MKYQKVGQCGDVYLLVFDAGDEIATELQKFAAEFDGRLASFSAIGALSSVELVAYDPAIKDYRTSVTLDEQCELACMVGDIGRHEGKPVIHAYLTIGKLDGAVRAGHKTAVVRPTCELLLTVHRAVVEKRRDERWNLPLFKL